jgi:CheY-like chemotaxis protein
MTGPAATKCAWILGGALDAWSDIAHALRQWGIEAQTLDPGVDLRTIAEQAEHQGGVIVIDLMDQVERGIGAIRSCRSYSPSIPIIPVVSNPSMDLAQRLRTLGVFSLAVHPLDPAKVRRALEDAFLHIETTRAVARPGSKKILIIDDDQDYCRSIQALLQDAGYEVFCAATGSEGLEMVVSKKPDLIVLDVMMENMWAGYEVNQTLKFRSGYESARKVPIVMVSSIETQPAERFARSADAAMINPDVYLTKPLNVRSFLETVNSLLKTAP